MNKTPDGYVFDSFAFLAFLDGEGGADRVQELLTAAARGEVTIFLSMINLGEVLYIVERERGLMRAQQVLAMMEQLPIHLVEATRDRVLAAAHIKANVRLSYGDAFAVATAREVAGIVITGDPEFAVVEHLVTVEWLR